MTLKEVYEYMHSSWDIITWEKIKKKIKNKNMRILNCYVTKTICSLISS